MRSIFLKLLASVMLITSIYEARANSPYDRALGHIEIAEIAFEEEKFKVALEYAEKATGQLNEMTAVTQDRPFLLSYSDYIKALSNLEFTKADTSNYYTKSKYYNRAFSYISGACNSYFLQACEELLEMPAPYTVNFSVMVNHERRKFWAAQHLYKHTKKEIYLVEQARYGISNPRREKQKEAFRTIKRLSSHNHQAKKYLGFWYLFGIQGVVPKNEALGRKMLAEAGFPQNGGKSRSGLEKWLKKEVIPTITGKRPLDIKPYISVTSNGKQYIKLSENSLYLKVGDITLKTTKLAKRMAQLGCIIAKYDVYACAPDIVKREIKRVQEEFGQYTVN